jgi:hypothetical protein
VVIVVQVEPVAEPPCMTPQGRVYERVSGETVPVEDPALLDRLFRRGEHARGRAEQFARRAAKRALEGSGWSHERSAAIAIGLAAVGRETDDIGSRLFVKPTRDAAANAAWAFWGGNDPDDLEVRQQQDAYGVLGHFQDRRIRLDDGTDGPPMRSTWTVQATWDGAVAASLTMNAGAISWSEPFESVLLRGWREIATLVERLGGYGPAHLAVVVYSSQLAPRDQVVGQVATAGPPAPPQDSLYARLPLTTLMGRTTDVGAPDDEMIASLGRELNRAAGRSEDEPEPRQAMRESG